MADSSVVVCIEKTIQIPFNSASIYYNALSNEYNSQFIASELTFEKKRIKAFGFTTLGNIFEILGYEWPINIGGELISDLESYIYDPDKCLIILKVRTIARVNGRKDIPELDPFSH